MRRTTGTWGKAAVKEVESDFTPKRLRQLIQLCHPDRHGGSPLANEVFLWLQEKRKALDNSVTTG